MNLACRFLFIVSTLFLVILQPSSGIIGTSETFENFGINVSSTESCNLIRDPFIITEVPATRCNEGWSVLTPEKCIKLQVNVALPNRSPLLLNYQDAREHCFSQSEGSSLLVVRSKEELAAVERLVLRPNNLISSGGSIWVDERQPRMLYEFRTIDNADMSDISDILRSGSVTDSAKNSNNSEVPRSCVRMMLGMRKELALSWRSESCSARHPVVCEKEPLPPLDPQTVEELLVAYHNSKAELNETKTTLTEMAQSLSELKEKFGEVHSELESLKERYKNLPMLLETYVFQIMDWHFYSLRCDMK